MYISTLHFSFLFIYISFFFLHLSAPKRENFIRVCIYMHNKHELKTWFNRLWFFELITFSTRFRITREQNKNARKEDNKGNRNVKISCFLKYFFLLLFLFYLLRFLISLFLVLLTIIALPIEKLKWKSEWTIECPRLAQVYRNRLSAEWLVKVAE